MIGSTLSKFQSQLGRWFVDIAGSDFDRILSDLYLVSSAAAVVPGPGEAQSPVPSSQEVSKAKEEWQRKRSLNSSSAVGVAALNISRPVTPVSPVNLALDPDVRWSLIGLLHVYQHFVPLSSTGSMARQGSSRALNFDDTDDDEGLDPPLPSQLQQLSDEDLLVAVRPILTNCAQGGGTASLTVQLSLLFACCIPFDLVLELGCVLRLVDKERLSGKSPERTAMTEPTSKALYPIFMVLTILYEYQVAINLPDDVNARAVGIQQVVPPVGHSTVHEKSLAAAYPELSRGTVSSNPAVNSTEVELSAILQESELEERRKELHSRSGLNNDAMRSPFDDNPRWQRGAQGMRLPSPTRELHTTGGTSPCHKKSPFRSPSPHHPVRQQSPERSLQTLRGQLGTALQRLKDLDSFELSCLASAPHTLKPYLSFVVLCSAALGVIPQSSATGPPGQVLSRIFTQKWRTCLTALSRLGLWIPPVLVKPLLATRSARSEMHRNLLVLRSTPDLALLVTWVDALHDVVAEDMAESPVVRGGRIPTPRMEAPQPTRPKSPRSPKAVTPRGNHQTLRSSQHLRFGGTVPSSPAPVEPEGMERALSL